MQLDAWFELPVRHHDATLDEIIVVKVELKGDEVLVSGKKLAVPLFVSSEAKLYLGDTAGSLGMSPRLAENTMSQPNRGRIKRTLRVVLVESRLLVGMAGKDQSRTRHDDSRH